MDATRARIVEAAIELYTDHGISATTTREIGERADVAPGTLRRYFPSRESLDQAMVDRLRSESPLPEVSLFEGADSIDERLLRLMRAGGEFFDAAARMYRMWLREPMLSKPWNEAGAAYGTRWDQLMRLALGDLADDADAMSVLRAVLQPPFVDALRDGRSTAEGADPV